jgi:hypothetical protein
MIHRPVVVCTRSPSTTRILRFGADQLVGTRSGWWIAGLITGIFLYFYGRAATLLLACMDDDGADTVAMVLAEAYAAPGGLPGLIAALAQCALAVLVGAIGEENTRATLNLQILNAEADTND